MAINLVMDTAVGGLTGGTTPAKDTRGATMLIANIVAALGVGFSLTDSLGNDWQMLTQQPGTPACQLAYVLDPITGPAHTFTLSGVALLGVLSVAAFSGVHLEKYDSQVAFDKESGSHNLTYLSNAQPGGMLPSMTHMLIVSGFGWASASTMSNVDPNMTLLTQTNAVALVNYGGALAYLIQDVQSNVVTQWNFPLTLSGSVAAAVFRAAYGGSDTGAPYSSLA